MNSEKAVSMFGSILKNRKEHEELEVKYRPRLKGYETSRFNPLISCDQFHIFFDLLTNDKEFKTKDVLEIKRDIL